MGEFNSDDHYSTTVGKGTSHAKMGLIKHRNGMDLTEAEDIKKRWQKYTEELYKKDLHNPDNHNGMITHLEPDILECEVKWALESITTCFNAILPNLPTLSLCHRVHKTVLYISVSFAVSYTGLLLKHVKYHV